jgi:hypothetical protein
VTKKEMGRPCLVKDDLKENVFIFGETCDSKFIELHEPLCGRPETVEWPRAKDAVQDWLNSLTANFFYEGTQKVIPR